MCLRHDRLPGSIGEWSQKRGIDEHRFTQIRGAGGVERVCPRKNTKLHEGSKVAAFRGRRSDRNGVLRVPPKDGH